MNDELKPCPFCGSPAHLTADRGLILFGECDSCGVEGPREDTSAKAAVAWNRRVALEAAELVATVHGVGWEQDDAEVRVFGVPARTWRRSFACTEPELEARALADKINAAAKLAPTDSQAGMDAVEATSDTQRLDYMIKAGAFVVWSMRDGSIRQCQVMTQDEDEEYHWPAGEDRYFDTDRKAIDAAMSASTTTGRAAE